MAHSSRLRAARFRYVAAIVALALVWLAMLMFGAGPLDRSIAEALYADHNLPVFLIARLLTFLGEPVFLVAAAFVLALGLWRSGRRRFALAVLVLIVVGRTISEAQKYWVARPRPDLELHLVVVKTPAFPSGHAASSMIFYVTMALAVSPPRWRRSAAAAAILFSLLIGISRVMLGVHWPSDVVGGWAFGLLWVLVTFVPAERLFRGDSRVAPKQL